MSNKEECAIITCIACGGEKRYRIHTENTSHVGIMQYFHEYGWNTEIMICPDCSHKISIPQHNQNRKAWVKGWNNYMLSRDLPVRDEPPYDSDSAEYINHEEGSEAARRIILFRGRFPQDVYGTTAGLRYSSESNVWANQEGFQNQYWKTKPLDSVVAND